MRVGFLASTVALAAVSFVPAVVVAQPGGVAPACNIDPNSPKELAVLSLTMQKARTASTPENRKKALSDIMKELETKPERFSKNVAGYNYMLSQALVLWAVEPGVGYTPTRAALGMATSPDQAYDLVSHLDSAYNLIATATPACAAEVTQMRQNDAWLAVTRRALDASNAGQFDTADLYAKRSLRLSKASPYPHYVMANVANARKEKAAAMGHWKMVIETAGSDTSYRDIKNSSLYYLAMSQLEAAQAAKGDEQKAMGKEAAASLKALFNVQPDGSDAGNVMQSWADAIKLSGEGDGTGAYASALAKPMDFNDFTLTMAGVIAARANKSDDALKFFEAATKKNANSRDALSNLASAYYGKDQFLKMFEPTGKLVVIDPNNYDAWMFYAYAAQGLAKGTKVPAEKKAWTDSLVKYQTKADALPVKAQVAGFQHTAADASLSLSLEQVAAADGKYAVTVEFLDASGAVVATATENVGPIKKGETKPVTVKAKGAGIQAYRYKPLK
jgi:hypothetical protein